MIIREPLGKQHQPTTDDRRPTTNGNPRDTTDATPTHTHDLPSRIATPARLFLSGDDGDHGAVSTRHALSSLPTMRLPPPLLAPTRVQRAWPDWLSDGDGHDSPEDELQRWSSLIGIITAICGNILIALALNVQRYAHIRLHRRKVQAREWARQARHAASQQSRGPAIYGAAGTSGPSNGAPNGTPALRYSDDDDHHEHADPRGSSETDPLAQSFRSDDSADDHPKPEVSSTYLKDPYWWLGQVLITVGESGNFLAYGFAPASIVSPLGVVALVSNCVIAPIVFKEVFRQQDFWGVIIAITGAVTVVLSANTEETKLGPHEVWDAITTMEFEIYVAVTCGLIVLLMWLSPRYGKRTILIDLGLVGLFGMLYDCLCWHGAC